MKKFNTLIQKSSWVKGLAGIAAAVMVIFVGSLSCFAAEGKVKAETAKIRSQASTDSEVVGSTVKGKTIDILEAVKDGSGTVWYKVSVSNGGFGYIRSDLVETSATLEIKSSSDAASSSSGGAKPADTVPTAIGEQQAVVKSPTNVRVRAGASTQHDTLASLPNGTAVTLIGEASDSGGNKWYQITCTYNNKAVEGYVRADLVVIGDTAQSPEGGGSEAPEGEETPEGGEGENPEGGEAPEGGETAEPQPEPEPAPENNDYEIVYTQDDAGEYGYYLYDNINGTRMKLSEVLNVAGAANESNQKLQDQLDKEKIIIIILAVVIVILFIVLTILLFKIRELYYEDYEDEDDDEDEEEDEPEPAPARKKLRRRPAEEEEEEEQPPVKKKRPAQPSAQERPVRGQNREGAPRTGQVRPRAEQEPRPVQKKEPERRPAPRKPQNFLVDDDEFEFEFLNMDDKDL